MNKYAFACITSLFFLFQPLHAGGPWLVYKAVIDGQGSIFPLNLAYDNGPQFAFTEQDSDEEVNLKYNTKTKKIWKLMYDGDNTSSGSIQNQWHRLSWGRQGNTFGLLYSQYEVVGAEGTPQTLKFQMLRLDGGWNGSALGTGSRQLKQWNLIGTLDIALTKALNDARGTLSTNLDAKNWIINYFVTTLRYTQTADVNEY
ncbi:hypothetical protein EBT11_05455 [bacterium]|nr:hypothetical protein [bacterium]